MEIERLLESLTMLKNGLMARATGGGYSDEDYIKDRQPLLSNQNINKLMPTFVRTCRNTEEFWHYIQPKFKHYAERRDYIQNELEPVFSYLDKLLLEGDSEVLSQSHFELGERLGYGGYGNVFLYHHKLLDMDFAIKILDPIFASDEEQKTAENRFYREAKLLFDFSHDNIVKIFDIGVLGGKPFIRMELIKGGTFQDAIKKHGIISFKKSIKPIKHLLSGLEYAHSKGIIHRDLKPTNVMYTDDHNYKIIDFGISAFLETTGHTKLTKTGEAVIGGAYSDPVLTDNPKLKDVRSDIYSIAAIWYYLLIGKAPQGANIEKNLKETANLRDEEVKIILKCLSDNFEERYSSCSELLQLLEKYK